MAYTGWLDPNLWRQAAGNTLDVVSTPFKKIGAPDFGISEWIAGGPTTNTQYNSSGGLKNPYIQSNAYDGALSTSPYEGAQSTQGYPNPTPTTTTTQTQQQPAPTSLSTMVNSGDYGDQNPAQKSWQTILAETGGTGRYGGGGPSPAEQQLNAGYDEYFRNLDAQMGGLDTQRGSQEQIANNTFNQGLNTVNSQYGQGQQDLSGSREKSLRDLANNLTQSWQQGNAYLGTRGASDSSAAQQYSYALTKMGNQNRGDIQQQYDQNMFKLKNTYDTETKNLELSKNSQLQQISQWFAEAQNALRTQKGQAALQKSQQALSYAMQMAQQVQQQAVAQKSALDTWAMNHSENFTQLKANLAQTGQFQATMPQLSATGGGSIPFSGPAIGMGTAQDTRKRDMFGRIIG